MSTRFRFKRRQTMSATSSQYDLTTGAMHGHIRRLALPAAVGLFCQTLFNMTDTFYAGYISTAAQSALAFSFPMFFVQLSFCIGIGQALTAYCANALGARRRVRATYFIGQAAALAAVICLLIWILLLPTAPDILAALGAKDDTLRWAGQYSRIIYVGAPFFLAMFMFNSALQAAGNTTAFRNATLFSVFLNVLLDPIFMFGWLGFPPLGIAGVGLATVVSVACSALYLLFVLSKTVFFRYWRPVFLLPHRRQILPLVKQALAPTGRMLGIGAGFFIITGFLGQLDSDAIAAYGIALRVEQLFLLPTIGLEIALLAFAGQNLGAGKVGETKSAYYFCLRYGLICMGVSAVVLIGGGRVFIAAFNTDAAVIAHGRGYLLTAACVGPLYVVINSAGAVLMGALRVWDIAAISLLRLIALPLLFFWLLAHILAFGVSGVWLGIFLSNIGAAWWMHRRCLILLGQHAAVA